MSTIKAWGRAVLVGKTIGSLTLGVGMRCRETVVDIIEKKNDPTDEKFNFNRCVLSASTLRLLDDIGVTEKHIKRKCRPAKKWKFVTHALDTMREGENYSGVAASEACYHINEGTLIRALRQEYSRFGGCLLWHSTAAEPFPTGDESFRWSLKKEYGTLNELEVIGNFSRSNAHNFNPKIFDPRQKIPHVVFDSVKGWTDKPPMELLGAFGKDFDVITVLGREVSMQIWRATDDVVQWQMCSPTSSDPEKQSKMAANLQRAVEEFHPCLRTLMGAKNSQEAAPFHDQIRIPLHRPLFQHEDENSTVSDIHHQNRMLPMGNSVIPVDAFGWRGDSATLQIQEASAMCNTMFQTARKYHRGDIAKELRQFELDIVDRRFRLAAYRDLKDAEHFLSVNPELPRDDDEEPAAAQVEE